MSRSLFSRLSRRYAPRSAGISRRDALKATLAASAGLLLSCAPAQRSAPRPRATGKRVIVIGGGFAGLACSHELTAAGYDVLVLEARARLGGRVLTFADLARGANVEGGGELIGSNHPTWAAYADKFSLRLDELPGDESLESPVVLGGRRLTEPEAVKLYEEMSAIYEIMTNEARGVDPDRPWDSPEAEHFDNLSTADWLDAVGPSRRCRSAITADLGGNNGVALPRQSYLGNLAQVAGGGFEKYWTDSEAFRCAGGNARLADRLADTIPPGNLRRRTPVTAVDVRDGRAVVTTADGRRHECDDAVLAVPPSVWDRIAFTPPLPPELSPQMGTVVKHLSAVRARFWTDAGASPDVFSDGDVSATWDATSNQPGAQEACLVAFSGGPGADRILARDPDARAAAYRAELARLLPGYADHAGATRFMDWPRDEWTRGGYSFPAPGEVRAVGPILRTGLGPAGARLHFAGEHACYKFVGYMEGALNSGAALAARLAARDSPR